MFSGQELIFLTLNIDYLQLNKTLLNLKKNNIFHILDLKTFEWDILNTDRFINLEIKNERRTSIILSGD